MIKTVIFDLDGTLADTMPDLQAAMNKMLVSLGFPKRSRSDLIGAINHGSRYFVAHSLPDEYVNDSEMIDRAHAVYHKAYSENYIVDTKPYDGIADTLDALTADGFKLAVLSNKRDEHVKKIIATLFGDRFASVYGQTELPEKPAPDGALRIAAENASEPDECVFIGDSDIDVLTAANAGMHHIGAAWGYRPPEVLTAAGAKIIAYTPAELIRIIKNLNK